MKATRARRVTAEILEGLLRTDLGFHGVDSSYGPHSIHAFAAKFPPQLPRFFIEALTLQGEVVLDPMAGSGTAAVEAIAMGRRAIAIDIDPLATLISKVKCSYLNPEIARKGVERAATRAQFLVWRGADSIFRAMEARFDPETRAFIDYWFTPDIQGRLMTLLQAIEEEPVPNLRDFLKVVFSSIIVTKSGGVSLARDLAHSRPHRDISKNPRDPITEFAKRGLRTCDSLSSWDNGPFNRATICLGDARSLPLSAESVDLIITSPPYANAIDYVRAHKFSLAWLGYPISSLSSHRAKYIGAERESHEKRALPKGTRQVIELVQQRDLKKALILTRYFRDMKHVIEEMERVLRPGGAAIIVVGPSLIRSVSVNTHECLAEIMASIGFHVVGIAERALDRDKRLMPASVKQTNLNGIEKRIHREFVVAGTKI